MSIPESNGKTVLITGINGYIASVLGHLLLTKGYSLRGTTRRVASLDTLLNGAYAPYRNRIAIYEVPDMTVDGAFDEAAKGVDGIFHTASPIDFSLTKFEQFVEPAKRGNETLLNSALKAGPQLTSVVITSSVAAVIDSNSAPGYVFTEKDFASSALAQAEKDRDAGVLSPGGVLYYASKTASERVTWKWRDTHKPSFAISTINPSIVNGPPIVLPSSAAKLNETLRPVWGVFSGEAKKIGPNAGSGTFVDVRDVAYMHVWAYENSSKTNGQRYVSCQGYAPLQAAADILRYAYKSNEQIAEKITRGKPGNEYVGYDETTGEVKDIKHPEGSTSIRVDGSFAEREMGFKYISFQQSILDTAKALEPLLALASQETAAL